MVGGAVWNSAGGWKGRRTVASALAMRDSGKVPGEGACSMRRYLRCSATCAEIARVFPDVFQVFAYVLSACYGLSVFCACFVLLFVALIRNITLVDEVWVARARKCRVSPQEIRPPGLALGRRALEDTRAMHDSGEVPGGRVCSVRRYWRYSATC